MLEDNNRYKNGKIYTIRYKNDDNLIYVGSTCSPLYKRWYDHKKRCLNENSMQYNMIIYKKIREVGNIDDWYIELYEDYPTTNKENLLKREGEIIRKIGTLNKLIPGRTKEEYIQYYKQYEIERCKERKLNKIICECGCEIRKSDLKSHQRKNKHLNLIKLKEKQEENIIN